jgi:hypothetical protein
MFLKPMFHGKKKTVRAGCRATAANGCEITWRDRNYFCQVRFL